MSKDEGGKEAAQGPDERLVAGVQRMRRMLPGEFVKEGLIT